MEWHSLVTLRYCGTETALARLQQSSLERVFAVNAFGPILVSKVRINANSGTYFLRTRVSLCAAEVVPYQGTSLIWHGVFWLLFVCESSCLQQLHEEDMHGLLFSK